MAKKTYPKGKVLIEQFINTIGDYDGFKLLDKNVICKFMFDGECYSAYLKCISHEGNPYPLEHQRAQLPQKEEFNLVIQSSIPFLFIGYDMDNDVYVCWEPHKVKPRLNKKSYVSFYSRLSAQQSVEEGKIKEEILTNGDKFVLFKRTDIIPFLQMIDTHFPELKHQNENASTLSSSNESLDNIKPYQNGIQGKIYDVREDDAIKLLIDSFPEDTPSLTIVGKCMNQYGQFYDKMQFSDWGRIIRAYLKTRFND